MSEKRVFSKEEFDSEKVEELVGSSVVGLKKIRKDCIELSKTEDGDWFDDMYLYNSPHSSPSLYIGIIAENDKSGVETYPILDKIKENEYPGISYSYFIGGEDGTYSTPDDVPLNLAMKCNCNPA